eukprot:1836373-Rhodomonas_salina.1
MAARYGEYGSQIRRMRFTGYVCAREPGHGLSHCQRDSQSRGQRACGQRHSQRYGQSQRSRGIAKSRGTARSHHVSVGEAVGRPM